MSYFYFESINSPTQFNLQQVLEAKGWLKEKHKAIFDDNNLQFDSPACQIIEEKHRLAQFLKQQDLHIAPETWVVDDLNYTKVHQLVSHKNSSRPWILKPSLLNNGEGIVILDTIDALKAHYQQPKRFLGKHVLQAYIDKPHLLDGYKYSLRVFVVLSRKQGAFIYREGYYNICRKAYAFEDYTDLSRHLTNEHLHLGEGPNNQQIPSSLFERFKTIYQDIVSQLKAFFKALVDSKKFTIETVTEYEKLAFCGFDFMLDDKLKLWLIEANHGPCFPKDKNHPLYQCLYFDFWQAIIKAFIEPLATKTFLSEFELDKLGLEKLLA